MAEMLLENVCERKPFVGKVQWNCERSNMFLCAFHLRLPSTNTGNEISHHKIDDNTHYYMKA